MTDNDFWCCSAALQQGALNKQPFPGDTEILERTMATHLAIKSYVFFFWGGCGSNLQQNQALALGLRDSLRNDLGDLM